MMCMLQIVQNLNANLYYMLHEIDKIRSFEMCTIHYKICQNLLFLCSLKYEVVCIEILHHCNIHYQLFIEF
jgi:hypothetical protein